MHEAVEFAQVQAQALKDLFPEINRPDARILDFGCGNGLLTNYVHDLFWHAHVLGVDNEVTFNQHVINPQLEFKKTNYLTEIAPRSFDLIYAAQVLHHMPINEHQTIINRLVSLLKTNGYLATLELNPWNVRTRMQFNKNPDEQDAHLLSPRHIHHLFSSYANKKIYYYGFPTFIINRKISRTISSHLPWGSWYLFFVF